MRPTVALAVLATVVAAAAPNLARAEPQPQPGRPCTVAAVEDPTAEAGRRTGSVDAGPIAFPDADPAVAHTGHLTCAVTVDGSTVALVTGPDSPLAASLLPTLVSFTAEPGSTVAACTRLTVDGTDYYWDDANASWEATPGLACQFPAFPVAGTPEPMFPPAGFLVTEVTWSHAPGQAPVFTPPGAASTPAQWTCTTDVGATTAHAACEPLPGQDQPGTTGWACYDPFVRVSVQTPAGATGRSVAGTARCGGTVAFCTASSSATQPVGLCQQAAFPHAAPPLVCDADFSQAASDTTWSVRCTPIDP